MCKRIKAGKSDCKNASAKVEAEKTRTFEKKHQSNNKMQNITG